MKHPLVYRGKENKKADKLKFMGSFDFGGIPVNCLESWRIFRQNFHELSRNGLFINTLKKVAPLC